MEQYCLNPTVIKSSNESYVNIGANGETNWYVIDGDITINGQLKFYDSASHLILMDGASLTVNSASDGIYAFNGSLTIYGQSGGTGQLSSTSGGSGGSGHGIYGFNYPLTINGGNISATGPGGIIAGRITVNRGIVNVELHVVT